MYDILGLVIGAISLLAFAKHAKRLVARRLPPGRVRTLEASIAEMRTLVDRLEGGSRFGAGGAMDAAAVRGRLDGCVSVLNLCAAAVYAGLRRGRFARMANDLWLEVARWEALGIARVRSPHGGREFVRLHGDLRRVVEDCRRDLVRGCLDAADDRTRSASSIADTLVPCVKSGSDATVDACSDTTVLDGDVGIRGPSEAREGARASWVVASEAETISPGRGTPHPGSAEAPRTVPSEETKPTVMPRASVDITSSSDVDTELYYLEIDDHPRPGRCGPVLRGGDPNSIEACGTGAGLRARRRVAVSTGKRARG